MNREYRHTVIAGNWKMNLLASDVKAFADTLNSIVPGFHEWCDVVVCAPFTSIYAAMNAFENSHVGVGAQNINHHDSGAYTGEVSGAQIADLGARYVIIGHSERRAYFLETDDIVNKKVHAAHANSLYPIICVGESLEQRGIGVTNDLVAMQIKAALHGIDAEALSNTIIAYEPIWAIGTGMTATPEDAQAVCLEIRSVIGSLYSADAAECISILYGGSMNDKNAYDLLEQPDIDGGLIGGASLDPEKFAAIINSANQN